MTINCNYRYWTAVTSALLFVFFLVASTRGFDFTDEGYVLYAYQNFFSDPTNSSYFHSLYLTGAVGGLWNALLGAGGWYSFRVLNAIVVVGGYVLVCAMLREYARQKLFVFLGYVLVVVCMYLSHGTLVFHYYTFSAFMNVAIALVLYHALRRNSCAALFVSSLLVGVDVFVRIPNLVFCALPYALLLVRYLYEKDWHALCRQAGIVTGGIACGVALSLVLICACGHLGFFMQAMRELSDIGCDASNSHGVIQMLMTTLSNLLVVMKYMLIILMVGSALRLVGKVVTPRWLSLCVYAVLFFSPLVTHRVAGIWIGSGYKHTFVLIAISWVFLLCVVVKRYKESCVVYLATIVFLVSNLQPLGSDGGIGHMGTYSIWSLVPASFAFFFSTVAEGKRRMAYRYVMYVFMLHVFYYSFYDARMVKNYCYRDEGLKGQMTYRIKNSPLATVLTSRERGEEVDSVIQISRSAWKEGDTAMFVPDVPAMYYLTRTKPFLHKPWLNLMQEDKAVKTFAQLREEDLPQMMVFEKQRSATSIHRMYMLRLIHKLIDEHGYTKIYDGKEFDVYRRQAP